MSEKLFLLQLRLKKGSVNIARKYDEVDRLCTTYTNQIKKYMNALNNAVELICSVLETGSSSSAKVSTQEPQMIENEKITDFFMNSSENILNFIENNFGGEEKLSHSAIQFILSYYHFFWTKNYCDSFSELITKSSQATGLKLCQLLMLQPNVQMYCINVLRPVFEQFRTKQVFELTEIFNQNAIKYAPMLPQFARVALKSLDAPGHAFWSLIEPIMKNYTLFGVCEAEMLLFINQNELEIFASTLSDYFTNENCESLMEKILSCSESLSVIPSEEQLSKIFPGYVPFTLVSKSFFDAKLEGYEDIKAPTNNLFFVETGKAKENNEPQKGEEYQLIDLIRKFLLRATLLKVPDEHPKALDYFQALAELSSVYGDPDLEDLLDNIASIIPQDTQIEKIENKLTEILDYESKSEKENPLVTISSYSAQQAYLERLTEYFRQFETSSKDTFELSAIIKFFETQKIDNISTPEAFLKQYEALAQQYEAKTPSQLRGIFTCLGNFSGLFNNVQVDSENVEQDARLRTHIAGIGPELSGAQKFDWLDQFKADKTKLFSFNQEISAATKSPSPLQAAIKIHAAYQDLTGLLMIADIGEIGADQLTPFAIVAIANANPPGLFILSKMLQEYVSPLFGGKSPLDHDVEYSVVQFLSTIKSFQDYSHEIEY